MKIAQICPYDFSRHGGVKTHILQLSQELRDQGHEVEVIAPAGARELSYSHVHTFGRNVSVPFMGTKIDVNICLGKERKRLKCFLKEQHFDIIHFHTIWNPFLPFQVFFMASCRKVATFHDTPKNHGLGRFVGRWVMPLMAKLIFAGLDEIISVSKSQSQFITRFSKRTVHIIPNGISVPRFDLDTDEQKPGKEPLKLLFLGRLEPRKGVLHALKAYRLMVERMPTLALTIAGEGDELEMAKSFVATNHLPAVTFIEEVSDSEKWSLLRSCDVYLASAIFGESFGIVLLEAMLADTLIAGYANDGYKNVLGISQLKYFAEPGDYSSLAEKCLTLLNLSEKEKGKLIQSGHEISRKYHWNGLVQDILRIYSHN